MLMCRGKGCHWRRQCSRYVLGKAAKAVDMSAEWMDHCMRHQDKFIAVNSEEGRRVAAQLEKVKNSDSGDSSETASEKSKPKLTPI